MDTYLGSVVAALAAGAVAKLGEVAGKGVLDAYEALKQLIADRYNRRGAVAALEEDPHSETQQRALAEALGRVVATPDPELAAAARTLTEELERCPAGQLESVGVKIERLKALNLEFDRVLVEGGGTGVLIADSTIEGAVKFGEVAVRGAPRPN